MKASDIIDTFHILRETKVAIILGKKLGDDAYGVK